MGTQQRETKTKSLWEDEGGQEDYEDYDLIKINKLGIDYNTRGFIYITMTHTNDYVLKRRES